MYSKMRSYVVGIALPLSLLACGREAERSPRLEENPDWSKPTVVVEGGVRFVENAEPRARLSVESADAPLSGARLLFWGDQAAARDSSGIHYVAENGDHQILMFDRRLEFLGALRPQAPDGGRLDRPLTVSMGPGDLLAAFEAAGTVVLFDRWGRDFHRVETPFSYAVGVWVPGTGLTLARSPYRVAFAPEPGDPPLLMVLDPTREREPRPLGEAREAISPFYTHAANAGSVTADSEGALFFAALGRAEVERYGPDGSKIWVSRRPAGFDTPEPRLVPNPDGPARLRLATVQKAVRMGPDGRLYVRSAADGAGARDRLDVLDPATGSWLASGMLDTGTAVLVGPRGAAWELPRTALLSEMNRERRTFRNFALETFEGDSLALADLNGAVTLVSFWASWCGPCRQELPLLDSLHRAIDRQDFRVVGINEDVNETDARDFARELGLSFPNLLGRGRMRQRYHYSGLPYSVLLDREGDIVREYYGFGGRQAFDRDVAARVQAELSAVPASPPGGTGARNRGDTTPADRKPRERTGPSPHATVMHPDTASAAGPMIHDHGPTREVTGREIDRLSRHLNDIAELEPHAPMDVPASHWEVLRDGLAQADAARDDFLARFPGTPQLVQFLALRTQLHVDIERLPALDDPETFPARWQEHLEAIRNLLGLYEWYRARRPAADSVPTASDTVG